MEVVLYDFFDEFHANGNAVGVASAIDCRDWEIRFTAEFRETLP